MRPRTPEGIRRHYSEDEREVILRLSPPRASKAIKRSRSGVQLKRDREEGIKMDTHFKDPRGKYLRQEETSQRSDRHGHPWETWEDEYLLESVRNESLTVKALFLGRTYRAAESRRRDIMRKIDKANAQDEQKES